MMRAECTGGEQKENSWMAGLCLSPHCVPTSQRPKQQSPSTKCGGGVMLLLESATYKLVLSQGDWFDDLWGLLFTV